MMNGADDLSLYIVNRYYLPDPQEPTFLGDD